MKKQEIIKLALIGLASCLFVSAQVNSCNPGPCDARCMPCQPDRQCTPNQTPPCAPCTEGKHRHHFVGNSGNCDEYSRSCYGTGAQCEPCKPRCVKPPKCPTKPVCPPAPCPQPCAPKPKCAAPCGVPQTNGTGTTTNS